MLSLGTAVASSGLTAGACHGRPSTTDDDVQVGLRIGSFLSIVLQRLVVVDAVLLLLGAFGSPLLRADFSRTVSVVLPASTRVQLIPPTYSIAFPLCAGLVLEDLTKCGFSSRSGRRLGDS